MIFVVGAGSVGSFLTFYLQKEALASITFVSSVNKPLSLQKSFLFRPLGSSSVHEFAAASKLLPECDLKNAKFIICTKAYHVSSFCKQLLELYTENEKPSICITCNGVLGIIEELRDMKLLPRIKLSSIINTHGTYIDAANVNNHATRGSLKMPADMDVDLKDLLERAKSLGASSMPIDEYDFAVWEKLLVNCCINPLTVLYKCKNGELESNQTALTHVHELVKELQRFTEWRFGSSHHTSIDSIMKLVLGAIRLTSQNYSSMYQDVLIFKRPSEIDYLNGFFTRLTEREALPYPLSVNNDIVNQIKFIIS